MTDRFGLAWRPELALDLHRHGGQIEILEFLAEDWLGASRQRLASLSAWCRERPTHLHGTTLGLASTVAVDPARLEQWKALIDAVRPARWSEHLAFVRGGGVELGHLAAPSRSAETVAGAVANLQRIHQAIGSLPLVENVATLIMPPGSDRDEATWLTEVVSQSGAGLLLDLHNLHANAMNQGWDARAALAALPLARVEAVHLAGGRRWRGRILDDHLHPVPDAVYQLLEELAARCPGPLDVIIERDGAFPDFSALLAELEGARAAVARGRARHHAAGGPPRPPPPMSGAYFAPDGRFESFLARLYTDHALRAGFLSYPVAVARAAGFDQRATAALAAIDREGLILMSDSLSAKQGKRMAATAPVP
jgi:uncharacterized protein (UPF0276 family)